MNINIDKETLSQLNCMKIALNNKPTLLAKPLDNDKTLIVVVDMINGFVKSGALSSPRVEAIIPELVKTLNLLPNAKKVFFRDCHTADSVEMKWFPPHCINKKESAIISELSKFDYLDVPKNSTNGLFALLTALPDIENYHNILITGCCTDICVLQFALALRAYFNDLNLPNPISVLTDCVETYDSPLHPAELYNLMSLKLMEDAGVQIFKNIN